MNSLLQGCRVVAVDDDESDLKELVLCLAREGIPCMPMLYNNDEDNSGIKESPETRLILMDINLLNQGSTKASVLDGPIASVIKKISPSGPCALILWSALDEGIAQEIIAKLQDNERHQGLPPLLHYKFKPKPTFSTGGRSDVSSLLDQTRECIEEDPLVHALCLWETLIFRTASKVSGEIVNLAKEASLPPSSHGSPASATGPLAEHLKTILKELATGAGETMLGYPSHTQAEFGLYSIFEDFLEHNDEMNQKRAETWDNILSQPQSNGICSSVLSSKLNAWLNLSFDPQIPVDSRGVFLKIHSKKYFKLITSIDTDDFITNYILHKDKFNSLPDPSKTTLLNSTALGLVEISAKCDYAQRKKRLLRFLPAVLIPVEFRGCLMKSNSHGKGKPANESVLVLDGVYSIPNIFSDSNKIFFIALNLNFNIGLSEKLAMKISPDLGHFRFRENVTDYIALKAAQHAARPGLTTIS